MSLKIVHLSEFSVIGKQTSTDDYSNAVEKAWQAAKSHFNEVQDLASKDQNNKIKGCWGLMSSFKKDMLPWDDNFTKGLYLAGIETDKDANAPIGWIKWTVPERDYVVVEISDMSKYRDIFNSYVYFELPYNRYNLIGAAFDRTLFNDNKNYIYFPVEKYQTDLKNEDETEKISVCGCHCGYCFFNKCGGCKSDNNFCSFATISENKICPNVKCSNEKGLAGCYECDELYSCNKGFFGTKQCAKASSLFIKKEGKIAFDKTIKNALKHGVNYSKDFVEKESIDEQLEMFYKYFEK